MIQNSAEADEIERRLKAGQSMLKVARDLGLPCQSAFKDPERRKRSLFKYLEGTILFFAAIWGLWSLLAASTSSSQGDYSDDLRMASDRILKEKPKDAWLIENEKEVLSAEEFNFRIKFATEIAVTIASGIEDYPIAGSTQLRVYADRLHLNFFSTAGGKTQFISAEPDGLPASSTQLQEVTVFGRSNQGEDRFKNKAIFYDGGWRSVMIAAIKWDPAWLQAASLGKLLLARLRQFDPSSDWAQDEVSAMDLEYQILNIRTKEAYGQQINKIVQAKSAASLKDLFAQVRPDDFARTEVLFLPAGPLQTRERLSVFWMSLANAWLTKQKIDNQTLLLEKITNCRVISSMI
jgi:hypothetical protein